jgi:hypothetical protein
MPGGTFDIVVDLSMVDLVVAGMRPILSPLVSARISDTHLDRWSICDELEVAGAAGIAKRTGVNASSSP